MDALNASKEKTKALIEQLESEKQMVKQKVGSKGKEKVGSSVWSDAEAAIDRAHELLTPGEMKEIFSIPSHEMVSRHVHKLM